MSERTLSIKEMQKELPQLPEQFEEGLKVVTVTQDGKSVMTILPYNTYQTLIKTIDKLEEICMAGLAR